ncbi:hypothetical protein KIN20_027524 [Parelaphostrongylus tenuis]|uniref:Secreted protein n=1 Tax=Parelaphostrongylus tenuis TaxID=148309 RepID=A0AAD5QZP9_PARTN|nr:hypothetical protein KIN20_027524 [Parelaphostrongylus tenuis]
MVSHQCRLWTDVLLCTLHANLECSSICTYGRVADDSVAGYTGQPTHVGSKPGDSRCETKVLVITFLANCASVLNSSKLRTKRTAADDSFEHYRDEGYNLLKGSSFVRQTYMQIGDESN